MGFCFVSLFPPFFLLFFSFLFFSFFFFFLGGAYSFGFFFGRGPWPPLAPPGSAVGDKALKITSKTCHSFQCRFLNLCMRTLCYVCVDQTGSKLRSCDWPSFKMNRPHLAYDISIEFQWGKTHKLSVTGGSRLLFEFERVRGRNAQSYPGLSY